MDPATIDALAIRRASEQHPASAWTLACTPLPALVARGFLTADDAIRLVESAPGPDVLGALLGDWEAEHDDDGADGSPWDRLAESVDNSLFPVGHWIDAYGVLTRRLAEDGRKASFSRKLGYLVCTAEFAARIPTRPALADIVDDMLEEFGFAPDP